MMTLKIGPRINTMYHIVSFSIGILATFCVMEVQATIEGIHEGAMEKFEGENDAVIHEIPSWTLQHRMLLNEADSHTSFQESDHNIFSDHGSSNNNLHVKDSATSSHSPHHKDAEKPITIEKTKKKEFVPTETTGTNLLKGSSRPTKKPIKKSTKKPTKKPTKQSKLKTCREKTGQESKAAKNRCMDVCHVPEVKPSDFRQISVYQAAIQDHMKQYPLDKPGPCKNYCQDLCGGGDMCTINHQVSNGLCICLSQPFIGCNGTGVKCVPPYGCVSEMSMSFWTWEAHDDLSLQGVTEDQVVWDVAYTSHKTTIEAKCLRKTTNAMGPESSPPITTMSSNITSDLDLFLSSCVLDSAQLHVTVPRTMQTICVGGSKYCRPVICHLGGDVVMIGKRDFSKPSYAPGNNQQLFGLSKKCEIAEPYYWNEFVDLVLGKGTRSHWSNDELYRMDFDGDGLPNIVEYYGLRIGDMFVDIGYGGRPQLAVPDWPHQFPASATDPYNVDTDRDLFTDAYELLYGMDPRKKNVISSDTDGDGLPDNEEQIHGTSPFMIDTDGDGANDLKEALDSTDPLNDFDFMLRDASRMNNLRLLAPMMTIPITLKIGDPSGSHSERYVIRVGTIEHSATEFGVVSYGTYNFRAGVYPITVRHLDSKLPTPDYDYAADVSSSPDPNFEVIVDDPDQLLGDFNDAYTGVGIDRTIGKMAYLIIKQNNRDCGYETCWECNSNTTCQWTKGACEVYEFPLSVLPKNSPQDCACHKCEVWAREEREKGLDWINKLPQCPCVVEKVDIASDVVSLSVPTVGITDTIGISWLEPVVDDTSIKWETDLMCNTMSGCKDYHTGAYGCLRAAGSEGSHGQQCCYDSSLKYIPSGTKAAGTPDFSRELISHYSNDVAPYSWCCDECEDSSMCDLYIGANAEKPGVRADLRGCVTASVRGDGICERDKGESAINSPEDCDPLISKCPDGFCDHNETSVNCPQDCNAATSFPRPPSQADVLDDKFLELAERCANLSNKVYSRTSAMGDEFVRDNFWVYPPDATDKTYVDAALISREYEKGRCIVALAGTNPSMVEDWLTNLGLVSFRQFAREVNGCDVREGWAQAFFGTDDTDKPIKGHFGGQLRQRIQNCIDDRLTLVFTGHSQGGALALVGHAAYNKPDTLSITFAAPPTFMNALFDDDSDPCPGIKNDHIYRFINTEYDELVLDYDLVPFVREAVDQVALLGMVALAVFPKIDLGLLTVTLSALPRLVGKHKGPVAILPHPYPDPEAAITSIKVYSNQNEVGYPELYMFDVYDFGLMSVHSMPTYLAKVGDIRTYLAKTDGFELGTQCNYDKECSSKKCKAPVKKICLAKLKDNTYDCDADEDCNSGRCNIYLGYDKCEEQLDIGGDCLFDTDCKSMYYCPVIARVCSEKLSNGKICAFYNDCKSGRCGLFSTCEPRITDEDTTCLDDADCATGRCADIPSVLLDECRDKLREGSDIECERDAECVDGSFCDGATNRCKKKLGLGKECNDHPDCESGRCDFPARKVCTV